MFTDQISSILTDMNIDITRKMLEKYGIAMSSEDVQMVKRLCDATNDTKCNAVTTKGIRCSKNARDGDEFCSVHSKKTKSEKKEKKASSSSKKKKTPPMHTHGFMSPPKNGKCELCEAHGMPCQSPEYEIVTKK